MWAAATETNWHGKRFQAMTNLRCAACPSGSPPAKQQVYNCAELHRGSEQPPCTLPSTESTKEQLWSWWDKVQFFAICPQLCCIFQSNTTIPWIQRSHNSEGFPLIPACNTVFLRAEALARQDIEKSNFFRASFPSYTASLQLNSDFVLLQELTGLCCPNTLGSLHVPRGKLQT